MIVANSLPPGGGAQAGVNRLRDRIIYELNGFRCRSDRGEYPPGDTLVDVPDQTVQYRQTFTGHFTNGSCPHHA
jgi:hypothetical protein